MLATGQDSENMAADQRDKTICPHEAYILVTWLPATLVSSGFHNKIQTWWLKPQTFIFSKSGGEKLKTKVWQGWFLQEALSPRWLASCCVYSWYSSVHVMSGVSSCVCVSSVFLLKISSSYKDTSWIGLNPTLRPHFTFFIVPSYGSGRLGPRHVNLVVCYVIQAVTLPSPSHRWWILESGFMSAFLTYVRT